MLIVVVIVIMRLEKMKATITKLFCKNCGRYLATAINNAKIDNLICGRCKKKNKFDIRVNANQEDKNVETKQ